jgi:hypothetical protein
MTFVCPKIDVNDAFQAGYLRGIWYIGLLSMHEDPRFVEAGSADAVLGLM